MTSSAQRQDASLRVLSEAVARPDYETLVVDAAERLGGLRSEAEVLFGLQMAVSALGADQAVFATFVREAGHLTSCRFMLACGPSWSQGYLEAGHLESDPWLAYACNHCEPIVASHLTITDPAQRRVAEWAQACGFRSTALFPVHSGIAHSRVSVLCLGAATSGFFEGYGFSRFRLGGRLVAAELHDWWCKRLRQDALANIRLTDLELELLAHWRSGRSSKQIAAQFNVCEGSINSRFQRLNAKLGVSNRRSAIRLAVDYGLFGSSGVRNQS